MLKLVKI